jgi:DNA-binding transcriptional regulator YiaG
LATESRIFHIIKILLIMISSRLTSLQDITLAIIEVTHDCPSPKTTDRLLALLEVNAEGLTIKEIADILNRPISMVQICLKNLTASRQVGVKIRENGSQTTRVYVAKINRKERILDSERDSSNDNSANLTPLHLRSRVGLSQQQVADALAVRASTVHGWEKGKTQPKLAPSQLKQMMSVYQCTLDELIAAFEHN